MKASDKKDSALGASSLGNLVGTRRFNIAEIPEGGKSRFELTYGDKLNIEAA